MKLLSKKTARFTVLLAVLIIYTQTLMAQLGDPGDDTDLPVDGGLVFLIAAGLGYGVKKYRDERKKATTKN